MKYEYADVNSDVLVSALKDLLFSYKDGGVEKETVQVVFQLVLNYFFNSNKTSSEFSEWLYVLDRILNYLDLTFNEECFDVDVEIL